MSCLARCCFAFAALLAAPSIACAGAAPDCHIGSYRLNNGELVDIAPTDDDALRWRQFHGATGKLHPGSNGVWSSTYGWTDRADGLVVSFAACSTGEIVFGGVPGRRIALDVKEATFESHGVTLAGRLVMPKGEARCRWPFSCTAPSTIRHCRSIPAADAAGRRRGRIRLRQARHRRVRGDYTQDFSLWPTMPWRRCAKPESLAGSRVRSHRLSGRQRGRMGGPIAANRRRSISSSSASVWP